MEQSKSPVSFSSWKCIRTTKVSFNLKSREAKERESLLSEGEWNKTYFSLNLASLFYQTTSWFSVCRSSLLWSMSSQQQKQPCTPPPPPQQEQVKQPCQPPSQEPFVPITKEPCKAKLPQPGNTKHPEPSYPRYPEPTHPMIPEPGHTKVPQPGQTNAPEPSPSTIIPGSSQKTKQTWCGPQPCLWGAMSLRSQYPWIADHWMLTTFSPSAFVFIVQML